MSKRMTKHEKDLEIAAASAPKYGVYISGGDCKDLAESVSVVSGTLLAIVDADAAESTKRAALDLLRNTIPTVENCSISHLNLDMSVNTNERKRPAEEDS